ncbi:MAG: group 1 truncated hemoglobin [Undibacterium sp.]|nr:group 1 truncated hemoglobin [Undibacterium sp.]
MTTSTFFRKTSLAFLLCISSGLSAQAQMPSTNDSLYQGLGNKEGVAKIVNEFVIQLLADQRIAQHFSKMNKEQFSQAMNDFICELAGGSCQYQGKDMYEAHQGMGISNAQFNAVAEDLQIAMEKNHVPSSVANKLIAKLAPMQRPIVSK